MSAHGYQFRCRTHSERDIANAYETAVDATPAIGVQVLIFVEVARETDLYKGRDNNRNVKYGHSLYSLDLRDKDHI